MSFQLGISEQLTLDWEDFKQEGLRIAIYGQSGSGKSHAVKVFLEEFIKINLPYVVIDPEGEYISFKEISPVLIVGGKFADIPLEKTIIDNLLEFLFTNHINIIFDISEIIGFEKRAEISTQIQKSIFKMSSKYRELFVYVVDEAKLIAPQMKKSESNEIASDIAQRGRKRGILPIFSMQRPSEVDKSVITQCNVHLLGKLQFPTDLNYIKNIRQDHNLSTEEVKGLTQEFYLIFKNSSKKIKFRKLRVKDLGKTIQPGDKIELTFKKDQNLEDIKQKVLDLLKTKIKSESEKLFKVKSLMKELEERNLLISNLKKEIEEERKVKKIIKSIDFNFVNNQEKQTEKTKVNSVDNSVSENNTKSNKIKRTNEKIEYHHTFRKIDKTTGKIIGNDALTKFINDLSPFERRLYFTILNQRTPISLSKINSSIKGKGLASIKPALINLIRLNYLRKVRIRKRIYYQAIKIKL